MDMEWGNETTNQTSQTSHASHASQRVDLGLSRQNAGRSWAAEGAASAGGKRVRAWVVRTGAEGSEQRGEMDKGGGGGGREVMMLLT